MSICANKTYAKKVGFHFFQTTKCQLTKNEYLQLVTDQGFDDDIVCGASSFYTGNRPILAAVALRCRTEISL
jgi:hypothetical protein